MHDFQKQKWKMESFHRILIYKSYKNCMFIILDGEKDKTGDFEGSGKNR